MCGYALLLLAFPVEMIGESTNSLFTSDSGTAWGIINVSYLLGGLFLLYKKIITWHIPIASIATMLALSAIFYDPENIAAYGTPSLHLFGSASMLGVFFIATDPISSATTRPGKLVYGIIIGAAIFSIRVWGEYPDPPAFAVLFGNFCAPLLDHYCRSRSFPHELASNSLNKGSAKP